MNKLLLLLIVLIAACNSGVKTVDENENKKVPEDTKAVTGKKWKADESTKKYVAGMVQLVNDSSQAIPAKRMELYSKLQSQVDSLVKYCTMKGPDHDALHGWLETVLDKMRDLKEEDDEFTEVHADLKRDIGKFYDLFE
jgi:hypothetical protein